METVSYMSIPGITFESDEIKRNKILSVIPYYFKVPLSLIGSKSRERKYCYPRQIISWFLRTKTHMTLVEIGHIFETDHTTVINSLKTINNLRQTDGNVRDDIFQIQLLL